MSIPTRTWLAGLAMQGILSYRHPVEWKLEDVAGDAVKLADLLLEALNKQ